MQYRNKINNLNRAFTLVELLVVITILGILASIGLVAFTSAQMRGRDAARKSDLKQIASALELFYADYGQYPPDSAGVILGCPYDPTKGTGSSCTWGTSEFTDSKTIYFVVLPKDPSQNYNYYYRIVPGSNNQKFQLFAYLENTQDPQRSATPYSYSCSASAQGCNFSITSANTTPTE